MSKVFELPLVYTEKKTEEKYLKIVGIKSMENAPFKYSIKEVYSKHKKIYFILIEILHKEEEKQIWIKKTSKPEKHSEEKIKFKNTLIKELNKFGYTISAEDITNQIQNMHKSLLKNRSFLLNKKGINFYIANIVAYKSLVEEQQLLIKKSKINEQLGFEKTEAERETKRVLEHLSRQRKEKKIKKKEIDKNGIPNQLQINI